MSASAERVAGIAVNPLSAHTLHKTSIVIPVHGPDQVRVRVTQAGICGTDREIIEGKIGAPPEGESALVIGHEAIGVVEAVGSRVTSVSPGDHVVATVRRPCGCLPCRTGQSDFCLWLKYNERGIFRLHGFMTEAYVEDAVFLVTIPESLAAIGVLLEPLSVAEKAWRVANALQYRIRSWQPETAVVYGAGPIGLLTTLLLRSEGIGTVTVARSQAPTAASRIIEAAGGRYVSSRDTAVDELKRALPNVDMIVESSGSSGPVQDGMKLLGTNGVMILLSITGGGALTPMPLDQLNMEFVLNNKVIAGCVNSNTEDFVSAVRHLSRFEHLWPGLTERMITNRLPSLDAHPDIMTAHHGGIKAVIDLG